MDIPEPQSPETPIIEVAPPPVAEVRGLRMLIPPRASTQEIDNLCHRAANAGINMLIARVYRRGTTMWPSDEASRWRLPRVRWWLGERDVMGELARTCQSHGLVLCAWVELLPAVDLSRESWSPMARRHWEWRMRRFTGSPYPVGEESGQVFLCPSRREVRLFLGDVCCELADRYPIEALWIEGLRFPLGAERPDSSLCFCPSCRARVRAEIDVDLTEMPLDTRSEAYQAWTQWRSDLLSGFLGELIARVRRVRAGLPIMAGVPAGWKPALLERMGLMDWVHWGSEGLIDLISPMWFGAPGALSTEEWVTMIREDFSALGPTGHAAPVLPLSDLHSEETPLLAAARALPLSGHVWDAQPGLPTDAEWEAMGRAHGDLNALVPEVDPLDAARAVARETAELAGEKSALATFLDDLQAHLQGGYGTFSDAQMDELLTGLSQFEDLAASPEVRVSDTPRAVRNLNWLQRQMVFLRGRQLQIRRH